MCVATMMGAGAVGMMGTIGAAGAVGTTGTTTRSAAGRWGWVERGS
jgi:hypothetical protein